jgi:hypothetical protein
MWRHIIGRNEQHNFTLNPPASVLFYTMKCVSYLRQVLCLPMNFLWRYNWHQWHYWIIGERVLNNNMPLTKICYDTILLLMNILVNAIWEVLWVIACCSTFSFDHCVVCSSSIYGFLLPPFGIFKLFLVQAFLKKWWVGSDFKAPNLPLSLRQTIKILIRFYWKRSRTLTNNGSSQVNN